MEYRQLRYFVAAAELGNIGMAAQRLNVSQPPVTRQIQALERELGVTLLIRTPRGVDLTEAGRVFHEEARRILAQTDRAGERARYASDGRIGAFDVGFFGSTIYRALPVVLRRFRVNVPEVETRLVRLGKAEQIARILDGRIHIGFGRYFPAAHGIASRALGYEAPFAALRDDVALACAEQVTLADLAALPMVLFPKGDRPSFADEVIGAFRNIGATIRIEAFADDSASALAQVACGSGCCLVPESIALLRFPGVSFVPVMESGISVPVNVIHLEGSDAPILHRFLAALDEIGGEEAWPASGAE